MSKFYLFIVAFLVVGIIDIEAQNMNEKIEEINAVCVSENDIWLGTNAGLVRRNIDNSLFVTVFNTTNSKIISNTILCVENDKKNIWVGTDKGISKFDGIAWENYTPDQDFHQLKIFDIAIGESELWLGTNEGLWTFKDGHIKRVFRAQYNNQDIPRLFIDTKKRLWFIGKGEKKGLYKIEKGKFLKITIPKHISIDYPIIEDTKGILWFSGKGGPVKLSNNKWEVLSAEGIEKNVNCGFFKKDYSENLWFSVNNVVGKIHPTEEKTSTYSFDQHKLYDIFFDSKNNPYVVGEKGIEDIINHRLYAYPEQLYLEDFVSSHLLINKKNLLVFKNELYYFDKGILSEVIVDTVLADNAIKYVLEGNNHDVFVGTTEGVTVIKRGRTVHYKIPQNEIKRFVDSAVYGFPKLPPINFYNESVYDDSRKSYWVSTDSLYRLFNKKWENQGISVIQRTDHINTVFLDNDDRIWVLGSDSCIYHRLENEWKKYSSDKELMGKNVISTCVSDTSVSIVYNTGASIFSNGVWKKYPTDLISDLPRFFNDGEVLWGDKLAKNELIKFDKGFWIRKKFSALSGVNNHILGTFKLDSTGTYIVTSQWVIKMAGKDYDNFFKPGTDSQEIKCFTTDGSERIIIGMTDGLSLWTGKFWISLEAEDGLISSHITGLYLTLDNLLLVSHTAGISTLDLNIYE